MPIKWWHHCCYIYRNRLSDFRGETRLRSPFWEGIYYMTLRFYCKRVLYLVSKHTKRYLNGKNIQNIRLRRVYYTIHTKYHSYIKGNKFRPPPPPPPPHPLLKIYVSGAAYCLDWGCLQDWMWSSVYVSFNA